MSNRQTRIRRTAFIGLAASLALLLSYVEFLLPPLFVAVPGIKLGVPNVVVLYVLYSMDAKHAAFVSLTRVCLSSLLFGNLMTMAYSVAGAILSLAVMIILKRIDNILCGGFFMI